MTMWEVLTLARSAPLDILSDPQVLDNLESYRQGAGQAPVCPPQPPHCPREIYDLMRECWNGDESARPAFREVHMFLQRKNIGYDPRAESESGGGYLSRGGGGREEELGTGAAAAGFSRMNAVVV